MFARFVGGHITVCSFDFPRYDVGTGQFLDELADPAAADGPVEAIVDGLADGDCELSGHFFVLYVLYTYRVTE